MDLYWIAMSPRVKIVQVVSCVLVALRACSLRRKANSAMTRFPQSVRPQCRRFLFAVATGAVLWFSAAGKSAAAQQPAINYDENNVGSYTLPDPLVMADGRKVLSSAQWTQERRPELLRLFEKYVYGRTPSSGNLLQLTFDIQPD